MAGKVSRLPPEVNRILFVKNLPFKISAEELFSIFGRYGALRQVRVGDTPTTKGTAFVIYEDILDARQACEHLSGFNVGGRYLVIHYFVSPNAKAAAPSLAAEAAEVEALRERVAAGEAAAAFAASGGGGGEEEGGLDDEADRRRLARQRS